MRGSEGLHPPPGRPEHKALPAVRAHARAAVLPKRPRGVCESRAGVQRPNPPCSSLARTTSVPLIWSPLAPSSSDKANRRAQTWWPCASWPLEAFLEVGRRLGTVDHCISLIPGPATPAQNSNIPSKHLAL